jgi:hypothetical protein
MYGQVTVHLSARVAPGDKDWCSGEIQKHNETGVWISIQYGYDRQVLFFPAHLIQRIEYRS